MQVLMMNARPFHDGKGGTNRWVIHWIGEAIERILLPEERVQEMLSKTRVEVPKPPPMVSAIEMDTPRRQDEAQRLKEMEVELKRFVDEQEQGKAVSRPPGKRPPPSSVDHSKEKEREPSPTPTALNSRGKFFAVALVLILSGVFTIFAFRQGKRS